jgi:hypothetical protein
MVKYPRTTRKTAHNEKYFPFLWIILETGFTASVTVIYPPRYQISWRVLYSYSVYSFVIRSQKNEEEGKNWGKWRKEINKEERQPDFWSRSWVMPTVTFARTAEQHCERSLMWLTARPMQTERTSFAKRVFCQEGVWQSAYTDRHLLASFSSAQVESLILITQTSLSSGILKRAECCLWINLQYQGHVPRNFVPPVTPVTYFHHSLILFFELLLSRSF